MLNCTHNTPLTAAENARRMAALQAAGITVQPKAAPVAVAKAPPQASRPQRRHGHEVAPRTALHNSVVRKFAAEVRAKLKVEENLRRARGETRRVVFCASAQTWTDYGLAKWAHDNAYMSEPLPAQRVGFIDADGPVHAHHAHRDEREYYEWAYKVACWEYDYYSDMQEYFDDEEPEDCAATSHGDPFDLLLMAEPDDAGPTVDGDAPYAVRPAQSGMRPMTPTDIVEFPDEGNYLTWVR